MPRTARASLGGYCYHVINRGNARATVCHQPDDYDAFVRLLQRGCARLPMRLVGFCLMPNHFHLALWPYGDGDLSDWIGWLLTAQVRRHHKVYRSSGHIWQGRFRAFAIEQDDHLRAVLRYIERNPLRAGLVSRAEDWPWSSLRWRREPPLLPFLDPGPAQRHAQWLEQVNAPQTAAELAAVRRCVQRGMPLGSAGWVEQTASRLGLECTLREAGRPPRAASRSGVRVDADKSLFGEE